MFLKRPKTKKLINLTNLQTFNIKIIKRDIKSKVNS